MGLKRKQKVAASGATDPEEEAPAVAEAPPEKPPARGDKAARKKGKEKADGKKAGVQLGPDGVAEEGQGEADAPNEAHQPGKAKNPRKSHAVFVTGCPADTSERDLHRLFPKAFKITVFHRNGQCSGTAVLRFRRPGHAAAAVGAAKLRIRGKLLSLAQRSKDRPKATSSSSAAADAPQKRTPAEDALPRTVYVSGCATGTTEEDLTRCFPAAEKVTMLQSRGAFNGRCYLLFPTAQEAQVAAAPSSTMVRGVAVRVAMAESPEMSRQRRQEQNRRTVLAKPWRPATMSEAAIRTVFPAVERVEVMCRAGADQTCCFLVFPTADQAQAAARPGSLQLKGAHLQLKLLEGGPPSSAPTKRTAEEAPASGDKKRPAKKAKRMVD